jgi:hypothetical protein
MDLSYAEDKKMQKYFHDLYPEWDLQSPEIEWDIDTQTSVSHTWNFSLNGVKHTQKLDRKTGTISHT